nr:hypothetical protein [Chromobacterium vaccinii]
MPEILVAAASSPGGFGQGRQAGNVRAIENGTAFQNMGQPARPLPLRAGCLANQAPRGAWNGPGIDSQPRLGAIGQLNRFAPLLDLPPAKPAGIIAAGRRHHFQQQTVDALVPGAGEGVERRRQKASAAAEPTLALARQLEMAINRPRSLFNVTALPEFARAHYADSA